MLLTRSPARQAEAVKIATCSSATVSDAVNELRCGLGGEQYAIILVFFSPRYDAHALAPALKSAFASVPVVACSTAGELTPDGMSDGSIVAMGFTADEFTAVVLPICDLSTIRMNHVQMLTRDLVHKLGMNAPDFSRDASFGLLLVDGLCSMEERIVSAVYGGMEGINLIGGSAGDGLNFSKTQIIMDGRAHCDAAALIMFHSRLPCHVFKCDHFEPMPIKLVVTKADVKTRTVSEINGSPAATEYAAAIGLDPMTLSPMSFASHPLVVQVGNDYFVRAIQKVKDDGSLRFFCAIDEGIVLTLAKSKNMTALVEQTFQSIREDIGEPQIIISFECVLRRLEAELLQVKRELDLLYQKNRVVGFITYGEQYKCMHMNHTLTGIAIGK